MKTPTPEERAATAMRQRFGAAHFEPHAYAALLDAMTQAIREAIRQETDRCVKIVMAGGDGKERLETAIRYGPNAAIAEAILEGAGRHP